MSPVSISARPSPFTIDPKRTAVIVVDMQNDFGSEGGMFALAGIDISSIKAIVAPISQTLDAARNAGIKIVYLKMEYMPDLSDLGAPDSPNAIVHSRMRVGERVEAPDGSKGGILIRGTWNTQIVDGLTPRVGDIVVSKRRFSGFFNTELDEVLKDHGITSLVFTGATTSVCVESTLRDAVFRDYSCLILSDCTAEPIGDGLSRSNHDATLLVTEAILGWVSDSASFISAFGAAAN